MGSKTAWPTFSDVTATISAAGGTVSTAFTTAYVQEVLDAVVQTVNMETKREFIPVTETRKFNGSDTGELVIDDFIAVTSVQILTNPGMIFGITVNNWGVMDKALYPNNRLYIVTGTMPAITPLYLERWPKGRNNIVVSATWGYGPYIPDDIWAAVKFQVAATLLSHSLYDPSGYLIKVAEADVTEVRNLMHPTEFVGLSGGDKSNHMSFRNIIKKYKSTAKRVFQKTKIRTTL